MLSWIHWKGPHEVWCCLWTRCSSDILQSCRRGFGVVVQRPSSSKTSDFWQKVAISWMSWLSTEHFPRSVEEHLAGLGHMTQYFLCVVLSWKPFLSSVFLIVDTRIKTFRVCRTVRKSFGAMLRFFLRFFRTCVQQCWAGYSKSVIYYSLLVTPFKSNIVTYYFLPTVISYTTSCITFYSCPKEVVTVYLQNSYNIFLPHRLTKTYIGSQSQVITNTQ